MSDDKIGLAAKLASEADTSGAEQMADALDKTAQKGKEAGEVAQKVRLDYEQLGQTLRTFIETAGIVEFLNESINAFYEDEKAIRAVNAAALAWGDNTGEAKKKAGEFTEALSKLSGVSDNQLTLAVGRAYAATGDLGEGMRRAKLATDIMSGGGAKDFDTAMKMVEQATNGAGKEIKLLVPEVAKAHDRSEFAAIALKGLKDRFSGLTESTSDNAKSMDVAHAKWELFQKAIGSKLLPAINWMRDGLSDFVLWLEKWSQKAGIWFDDMAQHLHIFGETLDKVLHGKFKESNEYVARELADLQKRTAQNYADIDADFVKKKEKNQAELLAIVQKGAEGEVTANKDLKREKEEIIDETQHYDLKSYYATLDAHKKAYAKHLKFMKDEGKRINKEIEKEEKEHWKTQEETMRESTHAMAKRYADFAKLKYDLEASVATGTLELLGESFGMQKEMAIASATINAAGAFISALAAPYPMDIILPVLVAAEAALQIAKITSQSTPSVGAVSSSAMKTLTTSGFDDPANDQAAYMGGRRWAGDMISKFTAGVSQGWASGMGAQGGGSQVTNNINQSRQTTINANIQDPRSVEYAKQLLRTLKMVDSNQLGQTSIAARTR